eukprot:COSAG01_NODE_1891_length_8978_cov_18.748170_4_plen_116_part_00
MAGAAARAGVGWAAKLLPGSTAFPAASPLGLSGTLAGGAPSALWSSSLLSAVCCIVGAYATMHRHRHRGRAGGPPRASRPPRAGRRRVMVMGIMIQPAAAVRVIMPQGPSFDRGR